MADAGGATAAAAEVTAGDLDLLAALDVKEGEDEGEGKGEGEGAEAAAAEKATAEAAAAEKVAADTAAAEKKAADAGAEDDDKPWFEESITDEALRKIAGEFETQDSLVETINGLQKALGIEPVKDWRKGIEDEKVREHASRFSSPADAVKNHLELRQRLSSALIPPAKGASKEDREVFASRLSKMLGVPEKPEGYEFPAPAEGVELTDNEKQSRTDWASFFHQIHLPKPMASAILGRFAEESASGEAAVKESDARRVEASTAQLEGEWGDDYEINRTAAARASKELFGDEFDNVMQAKLSDDSLLMDNTFMLRALARIGREMNEGSMDVMTDSEKETIDDQVIDMRKRAAEAKNEGNTRLANKLFGQEQELLAKVVGKTPIVGAGSRTA